MDKIFSFLLCTVATDYLPSIQFPDKLYHNMGRIGTGNQRKIILDRFIVFEGIDGAGTTTQIRLLAERCKREGIPVLITGEPTENCIGKTIRQILKGEHQVHPSTMPFLFAADRNEHLYGEGGILSSLEKGFWVLSDRYLFSSLAYQTIENDFRQVRELNSRFPLPRILFYLEVPPETGIHRIQTRETREIYEVLAFQQQVHQQYRKVLSTYQKSGMEIHIFDGTEPMETIHEEIWNFLKKFRY
ncbi:MAG: dTMP kinase [Spirochaetes bacterium]|nr:dTMP kinase [Spirochaetota bacterium]